MTFFQDNLAPERLNHSRF